jgi:hypothetical protein
MKKTYETPSVELLFLETADFLNTSGDAVGKDPYDDGYGGSFTK